MVPDAGLERLWLADRRPGVREACGLPSAQGVSLVVANVLAPGWPVTALGAVVFQSSYNSMLFPAASMARDMQQVVIPLVFYWETGALHYVRARGV